MRLTIQTLLVLILLLFLSGCCETKYVYVKTNCPKLKTYKVKEYNSSKLILHYKVIDEKNNSDR